MNLTTRIIIAVIIIALVIFISYALLKKKSVGSATDFGKNQHTISSAIGIAVLACSPANRLAAQQMGIDCSSVDEYNALRTELQRTF